MIDVQRALAPAAWHWTAGWGYCAHPSPPAPALRTQAQVKGKSKAPSCPGVDHPAPPLCSIGSALGDGAGAAFASRGKDVLVASHRLWDCVAAPQNRS